MTIPRSPKKLSPHFKLTEFRDWHAGQLPPAGSWAALRKLCREALEPLRAEFGPVTIHSGYRTHLTNQKVGGARHSHHLYDEWGDSPAADITCARGTTAQWANWLDLHHVGGLGRYPTHVHVDLREGRARW